MSHGLEAREGGHNSAAEAVTSRAEPQLSAWQSNQTSRGSQPVLLRFGEVDLPSDALDLGSPVGRTFHAGPNSSAPFRIDHQVGGLLQNQSFARSKTRRSPAPAPVNSPSETSNSPAKTSRSPLCCDQAPCGGILKLDICVKSLCSYWRAFRLSLKVFLLH